MIILFLIVLLITLTEFSSECLSLCLYSTAPLGAYLNLTDTLYFPPTAQLLTSEISSAHLWFYIRKHDVPSLNVSIEKILPHSEPGRTFTTRKMYSLILGREKSMGWKRVNMKDSLREWIRHPMTNFGLLIKAVDSSGNNLIVLPSSSDVDKGYVSVLFVSCFDK